MLTIKEVAGEKGVHPNSVWVAIKEQRLPAIRRGSMWFVTRAAMEAWEPVGHRPRKSPPA